MKIALIYDWADTNYGGAEAVLLTLHEMFPKAHLFTSFADYEQAPWLKKFSKVTTSFMQYFPRWIKRRKALLALLMPSAFESFDLSKYDLVISVASFAAKGVVTHNNQVHVCYLLTPTRFIHTHRKEYVRSGLLRWLMSPIFKQLRRWDIVAAWRPDFMIAISQLVSKRSEKYYQRRVDNVIPPAIVDSKAAKITAKTAPSKDYFLCVGRLVPYKKIDLVVQACGQLQVPLKIIGTGPQYRQLQRVIEANNWQNLIELLGTVDPKQLPDYYQHAKALIAPGKEDFGINLLEANSYRTLVICHRHSGARELLNAGMAVDLERATVTDIIHAIKIIDHKNCLLAKRQTYDKTQFTKDFQRALSYYI